MQHFFQLGILHFENIFISLEKSCEIRREISHSEFRTIDFDDLLRFRLWIISNLIVLRRVDEAVEVDKAEINYR